MDSDYISRRMAIRIDTLLTTKRFEEGGFTREQSETVAKVLNEAFDMAVKDIATRDEIKREFEAMRSQLAAENRATLAEAVNRQTLWTVATMIAVAGAAIAITRFL
jgi:hypothetical protein